MKVKLRYILISDDVRTERDGNLILISLRAADIRVARLPVNIPLAFTAGIVLEGEGVFELSGRLIHMVSGDQLLTFGATGKVKSSGAAYVPFKFSSVNFKEAGSYQVSLAVEGQEERITESFEVKTN